MATSEIDLTIVPLKDVDFAREDVFGEKACSLSRLISRGYLVPRGIVISIKVYKRLLNIMVGTKRINQLISEVNNSNVEQSCKEIQDIIKSSRVPMQIANRIAQEIYNLQELVKPHKLIMRYSTNIEETSRHICASQGAYLNLSDVKDILRIMKECWATAYSKSVIEDLILHGIPPNNVKVALIIEEMVPAAVSGLMRTHAYGSDKGEDIRINTTYGHWTDPTTGHGDQILIKPQGKNFDIETFISYKDKVARPGNARNHFEVKENHPRRVKKIPLNQQHIQLLIEIAKKLTQDFDTSYDVEFVIDGKNSLQIIDAFPTHRRDRKIIGKTKINGDTA